MSDYPMLISNKLHSFRNFRGAKIRFYLVTDGYFAVHSDCYFRFVPFLQSLKVKIICYVITLQGYAFDYKCVVP